jgi:hypothetical protein
MQEIIRQVTGTKLTVPEVAYMKEFCMVMGPVAGALDILQGEGKNQDATGHDPSLGYFLPTIESLEMKIKKIRPDLKTCKPVADAVLNGIAARFGSMKDDESFIAAAVCIPKFKTSFLADKEIGKSALRSYMLKVAAEESRNDSTGAVECSSPTTKDDYFEFDFEENVQTSEISADAQRIRAIDKEIFDYFNESSKKLSILDNYRYIRKVYVWLNTTLPASAAVERLFSIGGQIFTPLRNRMGDETFEARLFLRANAREFGIMKL